MTRSVIREGGGMRALTFGSVCSGMEAASLAWLPLGWKCAFVSEIDKTPAALLAQRYPQTPNYGDMTKFKEWPDASIELLVGGTPCQSFSVAGLRKGLDDPRGSLMLTFGAIAERYRPRWLVWENVPGVLSADEGRAFGTFLGMLAELGYGFAYRVLDAQFFNVAQRRARVFVVGYSGDWRPPAAVLFEPESLRGDTPPRPKAGQKPGPKLAARTRGGGGLGTDFDCDGGLVAHTLLAKPNDSQDPTMQTYVTHPLRAEGFDASEDGTGRGTPLVAGAILRDSFTGGAGGRPEGAAVGHFIALSCKDHGADAGALAPTLRAMNHTESHANAGGQIAVATEYAVRRLTPRECERLQGAPDGYTQITRRNKPLADGPRYKMLGNSMAVPVMNWIGQRIDLVRNHLPSNGSDVLKGSE